MSLAHSYESCVALTERRDSSPLDYWHFGVNRLRDAFSLFAADQPITELYLRACSKGGKSEAEAMFAMCCAQKRQSIDGVPLPQWRGKVEIAQLVLDYKQQLLSVQPAYERVLGNWPHKFHRQGKIIERIEVMPVGGGDKWSTIDFLSQKNLTSGTGVRADVVLFDEPPVIDILRELRKAAHAGRRSVRLIGATPTIRSQWQPLSEEYGDDCPRSALRRTNSGLWAECRWSLDEVSDLILTQREKEEIKIEYGRDRVDRHGKPMRDPLYDARIFGDYCDTRGKCPFNWTALEMMLAECVSPVEEDWPIREEGPGGMVEMRRWPIEIFKRVERDKRYWMTIDASAGIDDGLHDPFEIEVGEIGTGDLVLRTGGYLPGKLVGIMGGGLCRQYNNAVADFETNDRWGVNVMEGFYDAKYTNFARERRELKPGVYRDEAGFHNNAQTRPQIIGAVQAWCESWAAGNRYARCPSKFIIQTLMDCVLNPDGKIEAAPGMHDEALICWGENLRRAVTRSGRPMQHPVTPARTKSQELADRILGRRQGVKIPGGVPAMVPKARP